MAYERLLRQGMIRPYQAKPQEVERLLQVAARDLSTAGRILPDDADWAFNIVYNAVLQAARALVLHKGFRPRGAGQHRTTLYRACNLLGGLVVDQGQSARDPNNRGTLPNPPDT